MPTAAPAIPDPARLFVRIMPNFRRSLTWVTLVAFLAASSGLGGCAAARRNRQGDEGVAAYFGGDYARAKELLQPLTEVPDANYVLNNLRLGEAALTNGDLDTAERAYYRAYETLNAAGVNNAARSAATVLFNENVRIWLGEPYERAIANFQLGLIYYMKGQFDNARGAFENSLFKLRRYANEADEKSDYTEQESTFAVAYLMLGRSWQRLGREDLAADSFRKAVELDPSLGAAADPELNARSNVLVVIEWGRGPEKVQEGVGGVAFASATGNAPRLPLPRVQVDGRSLRLGPVATPAVDTNVMALQRRWQTTDTFRAVKAVAGTGLLYGGLVAADYGLNSRNQDVAIAGAVAVGVGALLALSSTPDTRQWEMVPRTIYVLPLVLEPGRRDVTVSLPDAMGYGEVAHQFRNVPVPSQGDVTLYTRLMRNGPSVTDFAVPPKPELDTDSTDSDD